MSAAIAIPTTDVQRPGTPAAPWVWQGYLHWTSLVALAVLVVNDHLLKGRDLVPEALTGKLSDFAGLFMFPLLLTALVGVARRCCGRDPRPNARTLALCCGGTALGFAALQTVPWVAASWLAFSGWVAPLVGGVPSVTMDPLDLVALPMCWLAWRHGQRWCVARVDPSAGDVRRAGQ